MAGYQYHWITASDCHIPSHAVSGGHDDGPLYVGRAYQGGDLIPGKVQPSHGCCYVSHGGVEHAKHQYEVLCSSHHIPLQWVPSYSGNVPPGAVDGGRTCGGEPLYVGRTHHQGTLTIGKVHPSHGCLYYPYAGSEHSSSHYEVLVGASTHQPHHHHPHHHHY